MDEADHVCDFVRIHCDGIESDADEVARLLKATPKQLAKAKEDWREFDRARERYRRDGDGGRRALALMWCAMALELTVRAREDAAVKNSVGALGCALMAMRGIASAAGSLAGLQVVDATTAASDLARRMNDMKHWRHRNADEVLPALWEKHRAAGRKKNKAAPEIAAELNLSASTVRRKLKGL